MFLIKKGSKVRPLSSHLYATDFSEKILNRDITTPSVHTVIRILDTDFSDVRCGVSGSLYKYVPMLGLHGYVGFYALKADIEEDVYTS